MKTKVCSKCKEKKEFSEFYKNKKSLDGCYSSCKECKRQIVLAVPKSLSRKWSKTSYYNNPKLRVSRTQSWRENNRVKHRRAIDKRGYGLISEESDVVEHLRVNGRCFCCNREASEAGKTGINKIKRLCLDHNHDSGEIRGMLCNNCNQFEGKLKKQIALGTITPTGWWKDYLENPPGIPELKLSVDKFGIMML